MILYVYATLLINQTYIVCPPLPGLLRDNAGDMRYI